MNSETIYTTLKHRILDLTLKPGQSMSEHELCERFGVSRTPVRTAVESQVILDFLPVCTPLLDIAENQNFSAIIREHRELFQIIHEKRAGNITPLMHRHLYGSIGRLGEKLQTEFREYFITKETYN